MSIWYVFVVLAVTAVVSAALLNRCALPGLEYRRTFSQPAYHCDETAEMVEVVRNDRPLLLPWLRVESKLPASFVFSHHEELDISGQFYHRSLFCMMPYQQIIRRHRVKLTQRGVFDISNASLTAGDLFGLHDAVRQVALGIQVLVYPRLLGEDEVPPAFTRLLGEAAARRSLMTDPFLVSGIRPYRYGDSVRDIHWAATARLQQLQVRTHDPVTQTRLMVLLNCQTRPDQWESVPDSDRPVIEYGISMAATMCLMALRGGFAAGFAANMPVDETRNSVFSFPDGNAAREEELLSLMAHLRPVMTRSFVSFLTELPALQGADVVILSAYENEALTEGAARLRASGSEVRILPIGGKETVPDA